MLAYPQFQFDDDTLRFVMMPPNSGASLNGRESRKWKLQRLTGSTWTTESWTVLPNSANVAEARSALLGGD